MSSEELTLCQIAGFAKDAAEKLEQRMSSSNEAHAASACLEERSGHYDDLAFLKKCVSMLENRACNQAAKSWEELADFLDNHATWPRQMFWSHFQKKLKAIGEASVKFREKCFFRSLEDGHYTIFHLVCKLDPPLRVVQTLIDIIPQNSGGSTFQYNNLSHSYEDCTYPLHMVMKHGGSCELVAFLVEADKKKETLETCKSYDRESDTLLHILISNKENHKPQVFSAILRYLIPNFKAGYSSELHRVNESNMTPVALLFASLKNEGLTLTEIFDHADFKFLLQATCYHQYCKNEKNQKIITDFDGRCRDTEKISIAYAFLVCSCCFDKKILNEVLEHLFSQDKSFLLEKDMH
jgi:hypothetical protein